MEYTIDKNKNLTIHLDESDREELRNLLESELEDFETEFERKLEDFTGNSEFMYCDDASFYGQLSNAPIFFNLDNNYPDKILPDEMWYFNHYALRDWRIELTENGFVEFLKA